MYNFSFLQIKALHSCAICYKIYKCIIVYFIIVGVIMTRKEERQQAFAIVFEKSFKDDSLESIINDAIEAGAYNESEYCTTAIFGVFDNIESIDGLISANLKDWTLDRISRVALSVMRLAVYEIKYMEDIPVGASINEAVELTKKFSTNEDASFVNGVLGTIAKA